jgi:hypothetical protein
MSFRRCRTSSTEANGVLVFVDVHRRCEPVVVNASSGLSGLYDSREGIHAVHEVVHGGTLTEGFNGSIGHSVIPPSEAKRKNFRWADLVQGT